MAYSPPVLTTKGDLLSRSSSADVRVAVGTNGYVLNADSAQSSGLAWVAPTSVGGIVKIAQVVTASSASTITFSSIAGTYADLMLTLTGRDTASGSSDLSVRLKINSDGTSGNYTSAQYILGQAATASANTQAATSAGGIVCQIPGSSGNANAVGAARIMIPRYAGTTFHKVVTEDSFELHSAGPSLLKIQRGFVWKSTAAVTDLLLTAGGTAFVDGTTATLYGLG